MPALHMIVASGTAQRRLLEETVSLYEKKGYVMSSRQEGGEWIPLLSENMSGGLFDENRLVVVDEAETLGAMPPNMESMVEKEASVIILLVYASEPGDKIIPKEIKAKTTILKPKEFPRWPRERQKWVSDLAKSMGVKINFDAIALMVELMDDSEEIRGQLVSLSGLRGGETVTMEDVDALCLDDGSKNLLRILDGLCCGRAPEVMKNFYAVTRNGELMPLISAIHNRMRLAWYNAENPKCGALYANALGARDYAWRQGSQAARIYPAQALRNFCLGLIKLNVAEKSGRSAGWHQLEVLLIELLSTAKKR